MARVQRFETVCDACNKAMPVEDENNYGRMCTFMGETRVAGTELLVSVRIGVKSDPKQESDLCLGCVGKAVRQVLDGRENDAI